MAIIDVEHDVWFTSDTHFCHNRDFIYSARGFNNISDHDQILMENWNSVVGVDDTVIHLGDVMLGDTDRGMDILKQLNGNIWIIRGNHDTDTRWELYSELDNVFCMGWSEMMHYDKRLRFYVCHYPTLVNNMNDKPVWCLHGHTHSKEKFEQPGCYNVNIDAHNNYPVNVEDIVADIKKHKEELKNEDV